jgi:ABC-2 type transport system permease protein
MIVGLLAANQMATGVIGTPIYLLLLIFPLYGGMGVEFMRVISKFLPTYYYFEMLRRALEEGQNLINMPKLLLILLFFILIFFIVLHNVYRKKGLE